MTDRVTVRVPATSANLGPGFDALGLALAVHDEVTVSLADRDEVSVTGEGAGAVPTDESHLILSSIRAAAVAARVDLPPVRLECRNAIPHARGLGSSAAAIVTGILAARALGGLPDDREAALEVANGLEGHPDNVAACLYGGLTISWLAGGRPHAVRRECSPDVTPVVLVPPFAQSTAAARQALPPTVPHADAAYTAGRAALLVAALADRPELLLAATEDRLHQPYRAAIMPQSAALLAGLRDAGIAAVVSGAGPTVLALAATPAQADAAAAAAPAGWACHRPRIAGGAKLRA
jgi:homoserine kinase